MWVWNMKKNIYMKISYEIWKKKRKEFGASTYTTISVKISSLWLYPKLSRNINGGGGKVTLPNSASSLLESLARPVFFVCFLESTENSCPSFLCYRIQLRYVKAWFFPLSSLIYDFVFNSTTFNTIHDVFGNFSCF